MYLSYSGHKSYTSCPRQYWHRYIDKTKLISPENKVNSLYGSIIGGVFELFYSKGLWRGTGVEEKLHELVDPVYAKTLRKELRDGSVSWKAQDKKANYASPEALLADVHASIPRGISIIREHRLLGADAAAEVELDTEVGRHVIGGRSDFIMHRIKPYGDLVILDGKGSKWRGKYVDPRQLIWYAMLHRLKYKVTPERLGFVYWRFEPQEAIDWVPFYASDMDYLLQLVLTDTDTIDAGKTQLAKLTPEEALAALPEVFPAKPGDNCKLCAYLPVCKDGQHYSQILVPIPSGLGVEDVGF